MHPLDNSLAVKLLLRRILFLVAFLLLVVPFILNLSKLICEEDPRLVHVSRVQHDLGHCDEQELDEVAQCAHGLLEFACSVLAEHVDGYHADKGEEHQAEDGVGEDACSDIVGVDGPGVLALQGADGVWNWTHCDFESILSS